MSSNAGRGSSIASLLELLRWQPSPAACDQCQVQLDDYIAAQLTGEDVRRTHPRVAQHLDSCVACAKAYGLLYELAWAEAHDALPATASIPEPNLGFLGPQQQVDPHQQVDAQAELGVMLRQAINIGAAQLTLQFHAALRALLAPPPATALVRSGAHGRYHPPILTLTPDNMPDTPLPLTLNAYADTSQPQLCLVEITVQPPGTSWPDLGGRTVTLTAAGQALTAETDDWGTAAFADIPQKALDTLKVDVQWGPAD